MLPVFKEYITYLNEKTNNKLDFLKEGYYWYDSAIIKAFDISGNVHKIARIYIDEYDECSMDVKLYSNQFLMLETWEETMIRNKERLVNLERESLDLIEKYVSEFSDRDLAVLSSGGKDSAVVTHLARKIKPNIEIIFSNTSLDSAETYLHIKKEKNLTIISPKRGFYKQVVEENFIPSRLGRSCCNKFKEKPLIEALGEDSKKLFIMGMRNGESEKRSGYGDLWKNYLWEESRLEWDAVLAIRKWSELDVWLYIIKEGLSFNPKYRKGYTRAGCSVACPYYTKFGWALDKYWYPSARERWEKILVDDFRKNNKELRMNCTEEEYLIAWNGGMFRKNPTDEIISRFAERNNLDINVAKKYFGNECSECGKKIREKDVMGMNLKILGRNTTTLYCKKHLRAKLNLSKEQWKEMCELLKETGCVLV